MIKTCCALRFAISKKIKGTHCSIFLGLPWYFMSNWLKVFPSNPGLSGIPFVISALVIVVTVVITVFFHSVKAAMANPANSLRIE